MAVLVDQLTVIKVAPPLASSEAALSLKLLAWPYMDRLSEVCKCMRVTHCRSIVEKI